ncbi:MAG: MarR family transcriptional regulator [Candidatus Lokiarchaeota archaeon]|nr:MarR family transcriptional regulator [Candidatus Lokiarchaeota archaeon]
MPTNTEKFKPILELTEAIIQKYLSQNKGRNINYLKEAIKDFLTNPLWDNDSLYQLKTSFKDLKVNDEEIRALWNAMEETFDLCYAQHLKSKSHIYEGKVRVYEKRLIEILVDAGKIKGQNAVFGSIIGYLLLHGNLTQTQLKELTGFSKGAISQSLKILSSAPAIKKEPLEGKREYLYTLGTSMADIATNIGSYKSESNERAIEFLQIKAQELDKNKDKNGYKSLLKRVTEMINFFEYNVKVLQKIKESSFITELREDKT